MTVDEVEKLKQDYNNLNQEYKELKRVILCLEKKGERNLYLLKKEELVGMLKYYQMQNRYLEKEMTDFCDQWINKSELRYRLEEIEKIKKEFKINKAKATTKKENDYWTQEIIGLINQEKIIKNLID